MTRQYVRIEGDNATLVKDEQDVPPETVLTVPAGTLATLVRDAVRQGAAHAGRQIARALRDGKRAEKP